MLEIFVKIVLMEKFIVFIAHIIESNHFNVLIIQQIYVV